MRPATDLEEAFDLISDQLCDAEAKLRACDSLLQDCAAFVGACRFAQPDGLTSLSRDATRLYARLARWSTGEELDPYYELLATTEIENLLRFRKRMVKILTEEIKERDKRAT